VHPEASADRSPSILPKMDIMVRGEMIPLE
jgi:hypothetical protein